MSELINNISEESDYIFEKKIECPICNKDFHTMQVKTGKAKFQGTDDDLRPRYLGVDTVKYDIYMCPHCGYAAVAREFNNVTPKQRQLIMSEIGDKYTGSDEEHKGAYTYDQAIVRYKMALLTAIKKPSKLSECAYLCLKLSWLYRAAGEQLEQEGEQRRLSLIEKQRVESYKNGERQYHEQAYNGLKEALLKEYPPICGMDEDTMNYLMSVLAYHCEDTDSASRFGYMVLSSRTASSKLKEKEREIMEKVKAES